MKIVHMSTGLPVTANVAEVRELSFDMHTLHVVNQMSAQPKALLTNPAHMSFKSTNNEMVNWYLQTCFNEDLRC